MVGQPHGHALRAAALAAALVLAAAGPARAVFTSREMDVLDAEPLFDSEYFLDLFAFSSPLDWRRAWRGGGPGYRINAASLDATDLFLESDLRLPRRLNDWLGFRYDLIQRGDKDLQDFHQWLALEAGPPSWRGFSLGLFGEPTFDKQDADIGWLGRWRRGPLMLYALRNSVDFNFNQRNKVAQNYTRKPMTYELGGSWSAAASTLAARVELDLPLSRADPATGRLYSYRRTRAELSYSQDAGATCPWDLEVAYSYEFKREEERFDPDPGAKTSAHHRRVHALGGSAARSLSRRDRLEAGAQFFYRGGQTDFPAATVKSTQHRRWEAMPYARWRRDLARKPDAPEPWAVGELAAFLSAGELRRRFPANVSAGAYESIVEAKLGWGVEFLFAPGARLGFNADFDLDDAGRHIWDGGNIRAMVLF